MTVEVNVLNEQFQERIQRWQSGSHLLNTALISMLIEGGWKRPTRKQAFLTGTSWPTMIRVQAAAQHTTRRAYLRNGVVVDGFGDPYPGGQALAGSSVQILPFSTVQPGVA